jgi:hypothetical protein
MQPDPRREAPLDEFSDRRARHECARIGAQGQARKPGRARQVDDGHPLADPSRDEFIDGTQRRRGHFARVHAPRSIPFELHDVPDDRGRLVARAAGAVAIVQPRAAKPLSAASERLRDRQARGLAVR